MIADKVRVGIVGVSGYGGGELSRLLSMHPKAELTYVTSGTYKGKPLSAALPGVANRINLTCEEFDIDTAVAKCDVVFLAGEAGLAMKLAEPLIGAGKKVIDLSADFRLTDPTVYEHWYKAEHKAPAMIKKAVYGLPEINRSKIKAASLIANPGCYPTSAILALYPLLTHLGLKPMLGPIVDTKSIIIDSYSGTSGAGRSKFSLDYHFAEVNESIKPYGVGGVHRHVPEIEQTLTQIANVFDPVFVTFTPHLAPITRGILTTTYSTLIDPMPAEQLRDLYKVAYKDEPFVVVMDEGQWPSTKMTVGSNYCYIGLTVDTRTNRVIVISAEDNLVKGMAGQAIQNMNLMCGFDETDGLQMAGMWP